MRPNLTVRLGFLLLCLAAGSLRAQILVSLGTTTACGNLTGGQTCTLTAQVTGTANTAVTWAFNPTVAGAVLGPVNAPNGAGQTTRTYTHAACRHGETGGHGTATASDSVTTAAAQITLVPPAVTVLVSLPLSL